MRGKNSEVPNHDALDHCEIRRFLDGVTFASNPPMAGFKKFQEIIAWQLSHELKVRVDEFIARPAFKRKFKFVDQLSDAVRSAPRNIAEGHLRHPRHLSRLA